MTFRDRWIDENTERLKHIYPKSDEDELRRFVAKKFDTCFKDNKVIIYNNYEKQTVNTTLYKTLNWIEDNHPITTESGSMFKQHSKAFNPDAYILGQLLDKRSIAKGKKFDYEMLAEHEEDKKKKAEYLDMFMAYDMIQLRKKRIANSEYGVSGLVSSWFFSMCTASATTARGQALISTAETAFEDFLGDNVKFHDTDECIRFIEYTIAEKDNWKFDVDEWVNRKNIDDVLERLKNKFLDPDTFNKKIVKHYLQSLSSKQLTRVYYKSNMGEFFRNSDKAADIVRDIVMSDEEYLLPTEPPESFKKKLIKLRDAVLEFVHFCHPVMDRVNRLKMETRKRVLTIDTDSCFINYGPWVEFVKNEIMKPITKIHRIVPDNYIRIHARDWNTSKEHEIYQNENFRIVHTMVFIITEMIKRTLIEFMKRCNLEDLSKNYAKMKNEYFYDNLLLTDAKKHYMGSVRAQEGNLFIQPKKDVKGKISCLGVQQCA